MRNLIVATLALGLSLAPVPGQAAAPEAKSADEGAGKGAAKDRILGALDLPVKAQQLRKAGLEEKEVKAGLKVAKEKKLHAKDAAELLDAAAKAAKEHGPVGNFGAFVQGKLDEGLRGKDLAEAIRKEHAARGKGHEGKGHEGKGEGKGPDEVKEPGAPDDKGGKPEDAGKPEDKANEGKGPPDDKGKPEGDPAADKGGKPEDKGGKPEDKGGKPEAKAEDKGGKPEAKAEDKGKPGK